MWYKYNMEFVESAVKIDEAEDVMEAKKKTEIIIQHQRDFFATGIPLEIPFRKIALKKLYNAIKHYENDICDALKTDLGKSEAESFMCEVGLSLSEISEQIKHLDKRCKPKKVSAGLVNFPAQGYLVPEPYGVVLIMSPWNYPFMLTMEPLAGAIAAGNCCVVKPSAYSPATSAVIAKIIKEAFPPKFVAVIEGGRQENQLLLEQKFDYIFFTGSVSVGKQVMEKAAAHLTPVTLELGGKSPCIVDKTADISLAAKRIVFGKFINCGQTCVAPDYILAQRSIKDELVRELIFWTKKMYTESPLENPDYGKIVNEKHFRRLQGLMKSGKLVYGGKSELNTLQIEPTILDHVMPYDAIMQEEIFGPILPVLTVESMGEAKSFVQSHPKPLACYVFTNDAEVEEMFVKSVSFGGGCINDTIMHLTVPTLPFGGVGDSGMGSYHGKKSFETFSHEKSILKKSNLLDPEVRYQPYADWKKKLIRMLLK